ncbi:MAG: hypothetical protein COA42_13500 [Alteromonadaceae bacterium]|nr:MAG: hypothetical protein COA42_13500 [Alteromonadaceae bacterium]
MSTPKFEHIRTKILLPFLGVFAVFFALMFWRVSEYREYQRQELAQLADRKLQKEFQEVLEEEASSLTGFIYFIQNSPAVTSAWLAQDRQALTAAAQNIYQYLSLKHQVSHFYFHRPDASVLLRMHAQEHYDDAIDRATLKKAVRFGQASMGLEFGAFGQFVFRVVVPWWVDGKIVGYIELGETLGSMMQRLGKANDYELILSVDKDILLRRELSMVGEFQNIDIEAYKSQVVIDQTMEVLSRPLMVLIDRPLVNKDSYIDDSLRHLLISQIPLIDVGGQAVGRLTNVRDYPKSVLLFDGFLRSIAGTVSLLGVAVIIFYVLFSALLKRYLVRIYEQMSNQIQMRKRAESVLMEKGRELEKIVRERDESRKRYKTLFEKSADSLLIIEGHEFVDCNQAAVDMLGYDNKQELCQTHPSDLSPEYQPDGQRSQVKTDIMIEIAFKNGSHRFEWDHRRKNGDVFPVEVLLTSIPYDDRQLLHVVWRDITERKKAAEEIEFQALYDSLTNLPNRRLLFDRINQSIVTARKHNYFNALLFVDVDRFKNINDSLGHSVGDALLIQMASRIQGCLTKEDTASRFGGDEFVILLRHIGEEHEQSSFNTEKVASKIKDTLAEPLYIAKHEFHITVSIGIALFPSKDESAEDIIKYADTAMYSAKEAGRNKIAFYLADMHEKVMHRLNLERDLRKAANDGLLKIYYQPQHNAAGDVVAVEALARWFHPGFGFVSPEEFITIAEETGIIFELSRFVLQRAVEDIVALNKGRDQKIVLAVNVSQKQFDRDGFVSEVRALIDSYGLERNDLTLEVTEGLAINNLNRTIERFEALRHLGVRLSLDDFGTGYSSLNHLKRLPLDELKIDKSFVFDLMNDPQDALLVKTIISIAHDFGLAVVAEGVETPAQRQFLTQQKCDIFQGYLYSRPISLEALVDYVDKNSSSVAADLQGEF